MSTSRTIKVAFITVLVGIGGIMSYNVHEMAIDAYIEKAIPTLTKWNVEAAKDYLSPKDVSGISEATLAQAMEGMSRLGAFRSMGDPKLSSMKVGINGTLGLYALETFRIPARFESGDASINIRILDKCGSLSVFAFHVTSAIFRSDLQNATHTTLQEFRAPVK